MKVIEKGTRVQKKIVIERIVWEEELDSLTKARYFFNWKTEKKNLLYKLRLKGNEDILGLMSLNHFADEQRFEIVLLAVSKENRGRNKVYEGIAGNLIAFAAREAIRLYAENGCVSLFPKTRLKAHYIKHYGMLDAGRQVFLKEHIY